MEFTAADAQNLVTKYNDVIGGVLAVEFNGYIETIKIAAAKGDTKLFVFKLLPVAISNKLTDLNFRVIHSSVRNEDLTTIYWG